MAFYNKDNTVLFNPKYIQTVKIHHNYALGVYYVNIIMNGGNEITAFEYISSGKAEDMLEFIKNEMEAKD